ncbi:histidine kinase [Clostridium sp. K25]|uniref:sensor histidine kinase n=1 Tax=Clostridium TaxID=1485 RepID=UPI0004D7F07E|nr:MULTISPECIES: PocR ligand-binding domain-containing protein [Clostridium]KEI09829.1 histidine kinase [Clostridium sp. K25]MCD3218098.1 histidine kinase [Clostridium botulinum C]MCD3244842.1 histidine kinase [Clostridium botulinum C]MCD3261598.1 histidine kinase [Clostridium botulinum C]
MSKYNIKLNDTISVKSLQMIQDSLASVIDMAIITVDINGKPITNHSRCCEFCGKMRSSPKYKKLCEECDLQAGAQSANLKKMYMHKCHAGLVDFAMPIIVDEIYLGAVMTGQVLIKDEENLNLNDSEMVINNFHKSEELLEAFKKVPIVTTSKIKKVIEMISNISGYIVEEALLKITQQEKNKLQHEYKLAELRALQSQINPHFLFNVLNSMSALSVIEKAPKTQKVILNLSNMLRYTLKKSNKLVTIEEEINYVESYLKLQKVRFEDRLDYNISLENEVKNFNIPFMSIQIFVENAVIHGIEPYCEYGHIDIMAKKNKDYIIITIEDNGIGIDRLKLKKINDFLRYKDTNIDYMGINNVNKRMHYYYNDFYSINIHSFKNKGTKVEIKLEDRCNYV